MKSVGLLVLLFLGLGLFLYLQNNPKHKDQDDVMNQDEVEPNEYVEKKCGSCSLSNLF